jgi:AraC family transcriptional regulator
MDNQTSALVRVLPEAEILRIASRLPIQSSCRLNWPGVEVHRYRSQQRAALSPEYCLPQLTVFIPHLEQPAAGEVIAGGKRMTTRLENGRVSIAPPMLSIRSRYEGPPHEITVIFIDPLIIAEVAAAEAGIRNVEIVPQYNVVDPLIAQIGAALDAELASPNPSPRVYAGSLAVALTAHILAHYTNPEARQARAVSLNGAQLRRSVEFIHENLHEKLTLGKLASVANMSKYHFAKSFRQAMGIAPHQYLTGIRIAKARELLSLGKLSIDEIASQVGYPDRSYFTAQFLKIVGIPPGRYRRQSH